MTTLHVVKIECLVVKIECLHEKERMTTLHVVKIECLVVKIECLHEKERMSTLHNQVNDNLTESSWCQRVHKCQR